MTEKISNLRYRLITLTRTHHITGISSSLVSRHELPQPRILHPRNKFHIERFGVEYDHGLKTSRFNIDWRFGSLQDAERPEQQRKVDKARSVGEVLARTYSVCDLRMWIL